MVDDDGSGRVSSLRRSLSTPRVMRAVLVCAVALVALTTVSAVVRRPSIERTIRTSVVHTLQVGGHDTVQVSVDGRDVSLSGEVASAKERDEIIRLARTRNGVRVVHASGLHVAGTAGNGTASDGAASAGTDGGAASAPTTPTTAALPVRKPKVDATYNDDVLVVSGSAPTKDAVDALVHRASTLLAPGKLVDNIVVPVRQVEAADMTEYRRVGDFLALLPRLGVLDATLHYDQGALRLTATVGNDADRTFLQREAQNLVGTATLDAQLTVASGATTGAETTLVASASSTVAASGDTSTTSTVAGSGDTTTSEGLTSTSVGATSSSIAAGAAPLVPSTAGTASLQKAQTAIDAALAGRSIGFAKNSADLLDAGTAVVVDVANAIKAINDPALVIEVFGYTDDHGSAASNLDLSRRRADSVRKVLIANGVPAGRVSSDGKGAADPVAPNDTEQNRAKNRRIEIRVAST